MNIPQLQHDKQQCEAAILAELVKFAEKYPQLHVTLLHEWQDFAVIGETMRRQAGHQVRLEVGL